MQLLLALTRLGLKNDKRTDLNFNTSRHKQDQNKNEKKKRKKKRICHEMLVRKKEMLSYRRWLLQRIKSACFSANVASWRK